MKCRVDKPFDTWHAKKVTVLFSKGGLCRIRRFRSFRWIPKKSLFEIQHSGLLVLLGFRSECCGKRTYHEIRCEGCGRRIPAG